MVVLLTILAASLVTWQWRAAVAALEEARTEKAARNLRQVNALPDAAAGSVPAILEELEANRADVLPLLRESYRKEKQELRRMRLALALLPVDTDAMRGPLTDWLLHADDPAEVLLAREALKPYRKDIGARLWSEAETAKTDDARFRALVALAAYEPHDERWKRLGPRVAEHLLWSNPLHRGLWTEALKSLADNEAAPLTEASYFPLQVGTRWHFLHDRAGIKTELIQEIVDVEKSAGESLARLETIVNGEITFTEHLSSNARGFFRHRFNGERVTPPIRLVSFPIRMGEILESEHRDATAAFQVTTRVGGDHVEVPAGKFRAIVVHLHVRTKESGFFTTYWFAAGVGLVKQTVDDGERVVEMTLLKLVRR
jgi:hypothetical protein